MNKNKGGIMKKKNKKNKVDFDLSTHSLSELIKVYENIVEFLQFLEDKRIEEEQKGATPNE
jgi:hypothetical protein